MYTKLALSLGLSAFAASSALAQLTISSLEVPSIITFNQDSSIAGVYRYAGTGTGGPSIGEPNNWAMQGETDRLALDSRAWAWVNSSGTLITSTPFLSDANNNAATNDRFDMFQTAVVASPTAAPSDFAIRFNEDTWADKRLTLKVTNNTGITVNQWNISLDTWFNDTGKTPATLNMLVGTAFDQNAAGYTNLGSRTGTNTNSGLSAMQSIGGTYSQPIANGDSVYIQLFYDQNGQGTAFTIDNFSISAVPEPSTYAAIAALGVLALAWLRRRR